MVSTYSPQMLYPISPGREDADSIEAGERQFAAATREMGAFTKAAGILFGRRAASRAAEHWLALAENAEAAADGYPNWRRITIAAASQLAKGECPADEAE
ncbi:MAG: hypothetical protein ABR910_12800 [Acidobacteriaceae bacterium]|jgi:hypothetical protein